MRYARIAGAVALALAGTLALPAAALADSPVTPPTVRTSATSGATAKWDGSAVDVHYYWTNSGKDAVIWDTLIDGEQVGSKTFSGPDSAPVDQKFYEVNPAKSHTVTITVTECPVPVVPIATSTCTTYQDFTTTLKAKVDGSHLTVGSLHRSGTKLTGKVTLFDTKTNKALNRVLTKLQHKDNGKWHSIRSIDTTSKFTVHVPKGTYRIYYSGNSKHAATTSATFKK